MEGYVIHRGKSHTQVGRQLVMLWEMVKEHDDTEFRGRVSRSSYGEPVKSWIVLALRSRPLGLLDAWNRASA
jgi:hypothetical protein